MDLVGRKFSDGGEVVFRLLDEVQAAAERARSRVPDISADPGAAAEALYERIEWLVARDDLDDRFAGALPYLRGLARVPAAHHHLASASAAAEGGEGRRRRLAGMFVGRPLPEHAGRCAKAAQGLAGLYSRGQVDLAA